MRDLPGGRKVFINEKEFNFSLANNGLALMRGLGGVTSMDPYDGMLFDFGQDFPIHMWAKNLKFPIEVAFLDSNGVVTQIGKLDPNTETSFALKSESWNRYALEVPVGFFNANNITIDTQIVL